MTAKVRVVAYVDQQVMNLLEVFMEENHSASQSDAVATILKQFLCGERFASHDDLQRLEYRVMGEIADLKEIMELENRSTL